jgi:hypothetical protein
LFIDRLVALLLDQEAEDIGIQKAAFSRVHGIVGDVLFPVDGLSIGIVIEPPRDLGAHGAVILHPERSIGYTLIPVGEVGDTEDDRIASRLDACYKWLRVFINPSWSQATMVPEVTIWSPAW